MQLSTQAKGYLYGLIAAVSYGVNPICAKILYRDGFNSNSVLFYRFLFGSILLASLMALQRKSFAITRREAGVLSLLGIVFAVSSLTYFLSFYYMSAGVAATLVFAYPVFTAILMALLFKERLKWPSLIAIVLTVGGIALLYKDDSGRPIALAGISLILVSALSYAFYIIIVNRSGIVMSSVKLTFYAMTSCLVCLTLYALFTPTGELQPLHAPIDCHFISIYGHGHSVHRLNAHRHYGSTRACHRSRLRHTYLWRSAYATHCPRHCTDTLLCNADYTR